jgi:hypothetical protein
MPTTTNVAQKLYLPSEAKPKYECGLCGLMFYADEIDTYDKHMVDCSEKNEDLVMERSARHKLKEVFDVGDKDLEKWVEQHREDIILGKKRM